MLHGRGLTPATPLSQRLREETRAEHDAIEAALDWERRAGSPDSYSCWLERLWGFHVDWEPQVAALLHTDEFARLAAITGDLARLGVLAPDTLPRPAPLPLAGAAEALGSLYVVEGSMLGGQVIARAVETRLGFRPAYHGAGAAGWRAFRQRLDAAPAEDADRTVAAARRTFVHLRDWLTR